MQNLDYWEARYDELFPNGLTQEETDEANTQMWKNCYPTLEMAQEQEAIALEQTSCYTSNKTA